MIEARNVWRRFGSVDALRGASLLAADGRVTALLGPNGAGKSTLMRVITGLLRPDVGAVEVDGVSVAADPLAARRRLGVLSDARGLHPRLSAREHLELSGQLHGLHGVDLARRIADLSDRLDLGPLLARRVTGFSQGERMKVALGRALVHDPPNLLLDEPQNGLDVDAVRALRAWIAALRAEGRAIVLSSHQMAEVAEVADDVVVVSAGRTVVQAELSALQSRFAASSLEQAYVAAVAAARVGDAAAGDVAPGDPPAGAVS